MKFDFAIGNPPYQDEAPGDSKSDLPVYHYFMDAAYTISDKVELITPAKFLSNAGGTPKKWNEKMLNDKHFKILFYESNAKSVFPNTTFTGGIAITYRDEKNDFEPITVFSPFEELNSIKNKVLKSDFKSISELISGRTPFLYTDDLHKDFPDIEAKLSDGHKYDVSSNSFEVIPEIYEFDKPEDEQNYVRVLGRLENKRTYVWLKKEYVRGRDDNFIGNWKVLLPKANGASGMLGKEPARLISKPVVGYPYDISTDTFICVGVFSTKEETENALKYINSKFARALLGILKVTQANPKTTWEFVPLQDFTDSSDIDWSKPISEIDKQLYKKYSLSDDEIKFIDSHVKEMN